MGTTWRVSGGAMFMARVIIAHTIPGSILWKVIIIGMGKFPTIAATLAQLEDRK